MVTLPQLRDARFESLDTASADLGRLATRLEDLERQYTATVKTPAGRVKWEGFAQEASKPAVDRGAVQLAIASTEMRNIVVAIDSAREEFRAAQNALRATLDAARAEGFTVGDDGSVNWPPLTVENPADRAYIESLEKSRSDRGTAISYEVLGALIRATNADASVARALQTFAGASTLDPAALDATQLAKLTGDAQMAVNLPGGLDEKQIPPPGTDPKAVAQWWAGLPPNTQLAYTQAFPERVGALNGVPVVARDEANRVTIQTELAALNAKSATVPLTEEEKRRKKGLEELQKKLDEQPTDWNGDAAPIYVIDLDTAGDGKWAVSFGNPDTARNTAVQVPGLGTDIEGINGDMNRARQLQFSADLQTPGAAGDVAVVSYLGYDAPEVNTSVLTTGRAEAGAPALDTFVDTLRTTHEGDRGRLTVVGHSYGSVVVGTAASQHTLDADDIVVVGSPGTNTSHASDMNLPPGHVWVGAAGDDGVTRLPQIAEAAQYVPHPVPQIVANGYTMGAAPQDEDYGGNRFNVDTSGHSDYWLPGSDSVRNVGAITVGNYQDVNLNRGTAPTPAPR